MSLACCVTGCWGNICLSEAEESRLKRTKETFYCSAGHGQHFTAKTEEQKRIADLERLVARFQELWSDADGRSRICPWPTCRSHRYSRLDHLYSHMQKAHGMPTLAAVREEAS